MLGDPSPQSRSGKQIPIENATAPRRRDNQGGADKLNLKKKKTAAAFISAHNLHIVIVIAIVGFTSAKRVRRTCLRHAGRSRDNNFITEGEPDKEKKNDEV